MPQVNLTSKAIEALKLEQPAQIEYWDAALNGFGLRVSRTGTSGRSTKTFFVRYRVGKRMRRLTIGDATLLSLAAARERARAILVIVDAGDDPAIARAVAKRAETFGELWNEYLERHAKPNKRSWTDDVRIARAELLPSWRDRKAIEITRRDVRDVLDRIVDRKAPTMANRTLSLARKIFNFGIERDLVENNPCHKIRPPARERSRDRVLNDDELTGFWKALAQEEAAGRYLIAGYFRIRLLTAQRGREVLRMRWQDISQEPAGSVWVIPGEVAKNGHSHRVPLSSPVMELLKDISARLEEDRHRANRWREMKGEALRRPSEWVFPSPRGRAPMANIQKAFERLRRQSAGAHFTAHDLRRTAATRMTGELKVPRFTVGRVLNHFEPGVTGVYDRYAYDDEKRDALGRWAQLVIDGIVGGQRQMSKVLVFRS